MSLIVDLKTEVVHRYVFELRYLFGHLYWDRCGKVINEVISQNEDWHFEKIDGGTCHLGVREKNLQFNYSAAKLDLAQTQSPDVADLLSIGEFGSFADLFSDLLTRTLELSQFPRIGFRTWYLYGTRDREESYERVRKLKLFAMDSGLQETLGNVSETSHRLVVERPNHMIRIAITPFEQSVDLPPGVLQAAQEKPSTHSRDQRQILRDKLKAKRIVKNYPHFGVLVDLDAYFDDPPYPDELTVGDFISTAEQDFRDIKQVVLQERA